MTLGHWQARLRGLPPFALDLGLAVAVALAMALTIGVAEEEEATRAPDFLAYLLGAAVGALLLLRRRWPMGVLIGSVGLLMVYFGLNYPAFSPAVPLAVAAYSAALAGHLFGAAVLLTGFMFVGVSWQTVGEDGSLFSVLSLTLADAALFAALLFLGEAVRNRRRWAEEVRLRLRRAGVDREREANRRVEQERLRIARDLHDVMAHTIAAINVQAGVVAEAIDDAPEQARASARAIREQSRAAMTEMTATVGVLRGDASEAPRAPAPGLAALDGLVEMAADAGVGVQVSQTGAARALPGALDLTAYRIVQESLTNVVRHAHASAATVSLRYDDQALELQVDDDGRGGGNGAMAGAGHGLVGMRERVAAVGGTLEAGPAPGGGYRVVARLPLTGAPQ